MKLCRITNSAHLVVCPLLSLDQWLGIRCRLTSVIRRVVTSLSDVLWEHSCSLSTTSVQRIRGFSTTMRYINQHYLSIIIYLSACILLLHATPNTSFRLWLNGRRWVTVVQGWCTHRAIILRRASWQKDQKRSMANVVIVVSVITVKCLWPHSVIAIVIWINTS